ncbi:MAG: DUF4340 domain-containing protein [Desulfarculaceae bacterium]|nr:DUF4340 domain-containing protein [Desulfarculaceae bacterium]MCF8071393.1 DUF4340 domain-containing protein [Desulfarculaceae bacterium]MCF8101718.1 DUF4340 domain-containing protein [Desulfarculaceae bacterium]MCF8118190.1 DUF4340 domain-containing protein [Desulfarculaceae bacterium]
MTPKKIVIWVLFLAVATALYFLSDAVDRRSQEQERESNRLITLSDPLNVASLNIEGQQMPQSIGIERREKAHRWDMVSPVKSQADGMQVGRLLSAVLEGQIKGRIEKPGELKGFGLDPAAIKLTLTDRKGDQAVLLLGNLSPTKEFAYAAVPGGDEVWLVEPTLRGAVNRTVFELRDKAVLDFIVNKVSGLEINTGKQPLKLERVKGGAEPQWRFAGGGEADTSAVEDLLFQVHGLMALDFLDKGVHLDKMGFEPPQGGVVLNLEGGGKKGILIGGPVTGREERYVRRLSGGPVMVLKQASLNRLKKATRFSLSQRRLMRFHRDAAVALSITRGKQELKYAKEGGVWVRTQPPGDEKSGEAASLLVWDLGNLKWLKILGDAGLAGLDKPRAVIKLTLEAPGKNGQAPTVISKTLSLGRVDKASGLLAAQVGGDDRVFGLAADFMDNLPKAAPEKKTAQEGQK